jgi:hypothetical protein
VVTTSSSFYHFSVGNVVALSPWSCPKLAHLWDTTQSCLKQQALYGTNPARDLKKAPCWRGERFS